MSVELAVPSERFRRSYLEADQEFVAAGSLWDGKFIATDDTFAHMIEGIAAARPKLVELWLVDGDAYLGKVQLRPGGVPDHVGIAMRPSARRRGLAALALELARPHLLALGVDRIAVMCDADNAAARRLVARYGGVLERDLGDGRLRFVIAVAG
ncbi:MAG TPA: GNAT family N-acetyltransferase [Kofleriaceae bacterium]|jgi:predicted acetyltransferase